METLRMCALTREKIDKSNLFRVVKTKEGIITIDDNILGRGVYLKKDKQVIEKAKEKRIFNHHLKTDVDQDIYNQLIKLL